jgi:hypothetical protein
VNLKQKLQSSLLLNFTEPLQPDGYGISALYRAEDQKRLMDIMSDIRNGNKEMFMELSTDLIDDYYGKSVRNDLNPIMSHLGTNIVTHPGISLTLKNITGEDQSKFNYIMSGTGNSQVPTIYSQGLEAENARMAIPSTGFYFASGTALFQGCIFPTTIPSATIVEFGSATTLNPYDLLHTMFWRSRILDPSKYINHLQNKTTYLHMHIIDFRPKMAE